MKYSHIINAFHNTPWMIHPTKLKEMRDFLHLKAKGGDVSAEDISEIVAARRQMTVETVGRVAVVPVMGVLSQRVSMMDEASGGVSTEQIGATLDSLMNEKQVKKILMVFDTPGGSVHGIEELATKIRGYRDEKEIQGIADSNAHSGGYYLLAQCSTVNITPNGELGNIGVLTAHVDTSEMEKAMGVHTEIISYPEYKGELWKPLTPDARAHLESQVKEYYGKFVSSVAKGRRVSEAKVEKDFGRGRSFLSKEAVERGMADKVATLEQVLRRMGAETSGGGARAADLDIDIQIRERALDKTL